jgi:hypothetical protein
LVGHSCPRFVHRLWEISRKRFINKPMEASHVPETCWTGSLRIRNRITEIAAKRIV